MHPPSLFLQMRKTTRRYPLQEPDWGFSMIEIVLVLSILLILTSLMAPMISPSRWRADSAVQTVALSLSSAQRLAVLRQHDVVVHLSIDDQWIRVHRDLDNDGVEDDGEDSRVVQLPETIGFANAGAPILPGGLGSTPIGDGDGDPVVTFHRSGSASTSGVVYLSPIRGSHAQDKTSVRALSLERATGVVRCYSYRTGAWEATC